MANRSQHPLLQYLRRLSGGRAGDAALDDAQLLSRFLASRDESAFTTIVQRYGAMVWGLCVRRLGNSPEAEDAFQATFLVLVRKAASLRDPEMLGPWLYGVAYRTATKHRGQRARRAARETALTEEIAEKCPESIWSNVGPVLDEEINRLPTKYRLPVLLCYLQGLSCEEAAQRLGCAKGTVFSRLSRARDLLRRRLLRRGVEVSAGALAAVLTENAVLRAAPSLALREITIRTSLLFAAGTAGQSLSAPLAALVEGVVRSMFFSKLKFLAIIVVAVGIAGAGTAFLGYRSDAETPPAKPSPPPEHQAPPRVEAPAPAIVKAKAPAPPNPNPPPLLDDGLYLREKLSSEIVYSGLEDARATLVDALDQLSKRYNINFYANEQIFRAIDPKIDVLRFKIADSTPIPAMRVSLGRVLRIILERLPPKMGTMYLIRKEFIEITTETAVRAELGIPANRPLLPLVSHTLGNMPIAHALRQLADRSSYNVVMDPRIEDELRASTNLVELNNVPVDTAVRLVANMAGMSVVRLDNVLYVTTPDNAKHLREEQAQVNAETHTINAPADDSRTKNARANEARIIHVNTGLLKDKGHLQWPPVLQREAYKEARENLNVLMKAAYKSVAEGNAPSETNLRDLRSNLRKVQDTLHANVGQLMPEEFITASHYLRSVKRTITALKNASDKPPKKPAPEKRVK